MCCWVACNCTTIASRCSPPKLYNTATQAAPWPPLSHSLPLQVGTCSALSGLCTCPVATLHCLLTLHRAAAPLRTLQVGTCSALTGLCTCPAGWQGFNCLMPLPRHCATHYEYFGYERGRHEANITAGVGLPSIHAFPETHCAGGSGGRHAWECVAKLRGIVVAKLRGIVLRICVALHGQAAWRQLAQGGSAVAGAVLQAWVCLA